MNLRKYDKPPFSTAVIHGFPEAPGYMAPVARELSKRVGVIEPLQTKDSLQGQIRELRDQLVAHADTPVTLIGSSWGAVFSLFVASKNKTLVKKLILIGSAVFDENSCAKTKKVRLERLTEGSRQRYETIKLKMESANEEELNDLTKEWADIYFECDICDPLTTNLEVIGIQYDVNTKVWSDFVVLRDKPDYLKNELSTIEIPTVVIHGDYDPHPIEGIRPFLEECLSKVKFYILPECGHYPWIEKSARDRFFEILRKEI